MARFVVGADRDQTFLLPPFLAGYVDEDNPVRVVDLCVDELDLRELGFTGPPSRMAGRSVYPPATMLKIEIYGYLTQLQSRRNLEREAGRNVELMWLTGGLAPDFKTIADCRKDNGVVLQAVCSEFVRLCCELGLFAKAVAAIDGAKFKAVNARECNPVRGKIKRRIDRMEKSMARRLKELEKENQRLRKTVSDLTLDALILKEVAEGKY